MGQPNLSRAIKELEENLGIKIFKRTSKGFIPTLQGEEFLGYAKGILNEIDEIEARYKSPKKDKLLFSISVPRSSYISEAFTRFVSKLDSSKEIEFNYKETNSLRAINNILQNNFNLGIIRYQTDYEEYFGNFLSEKSLQAETIWEFSYVLAMSENSPLAKKEIVDASDLNGLIEVIYGDPYVPSFATIELMKSSFYGDGDRKISIYERGSKFDLLSNIKNSYIWVSPIPKALLEKHSLITKKCSDQCKTYKDVLIYKNNYKLNDLEKSFISTLYKEKDIIELQ